MNINWKLNNESGRVIHTNGSVTGSGDNILLDVPHNIKIVMAIRNDYSPSATSAQIKTLRQILSSLGEGIIFSSISGDLEALAISIYHGNRT